MSAPTTFDRGLVTTWTRTTFLGWVLGVPVITALALLGEAIGIGGSQVIVGVGMGISVGFMQGRIVRALIGSPARWGWFWSCVIGLAVPFLVVDIANAMGRPLPYSLQVSVGLAGLIAGVWQARILAPTTRGTSWWILSSVIGFMLAAGMTAIADWLPRSQAIRGLWGALIFLGIIAGGGLVLGLVTGFTLAWLRKSERTR